MKNQKRKPCPIHGKIKVKKENELQSGDGSGGGGGGGGGDNSNENSMDVSNEADAAAVADDVGERAPPQDSVDSCQAVGGDQLIYSHNKII